MRHYLVKILSITLILLLVQTCSEPVTETAPIIISGKVLALADNAPLENAIVRIISPLPEIVELTDSTGAFSFEFPMDSNTTVDVTLTTTKEGYLSDTLETLAIPERDVALTTIYLALLETEGGDDTTTTPVTGTSGPATIAIQNITTPTISVIGSGGTDFTSLSFLVQDSSGLPVGEGVEVTFAFGSTPNGGEYISPAIASTDEMGEVSVNLVSGTVSGVVQILATVIVSPGSSIRSQAIPITIHGGLPDQTHFGLASKPINVAGWDQWGLTASVTAFVGDEYGNFCAPGVAVYFTTNGGMIEGSGLTNDGRCSATLVTGPPRPPTLPTLVDGFASIIGRTANKNNETIVDTVLVLFSGPPIISDVSAASLNIPNGGSQTITFTVADENGNPMTQGTSITASVTGENVDVSGDVATSLIDTQARGPGFTTFSITIQDSKPDESIPTTLQLEIATTGINGEAKVLISGSGA
jgi:hypothetical protein